MPRLPYGNSPAADSGIFVLLKAVAALLGTIAVLFTLLYSSYLGYTELDVPDIELAPTELHVDETGRRVEYGRSRLTRSGGIWQLYLEGSPVELGDAHGKLTARMFHELDRRIETILRQRYGDGLDAWTAAMRLRWDVRGTDDHMAEDYAHELAALAQAIPEAGIGTLESYRRVFLHQCFQELTQRLDDIVTWGTVFAASSKLPGSEPGNLVVGRSLSFELGDDFEPARVISLYHPDGKYPFASVGWPGLLGVVTGVNARGIVVASNAARTDDPPEDGSPLHLVLRQVLEEADTLDHAIEILQKASLRTAGIVLVGDGLQRKAVVLELSPRGREEKRLVRGEGEPVVWATNHLVRESFEHDAQNDWIRRGTSSGYRFERVRELLDSNVPVDPQRALAILRDRKGLNNEELGLGNRNAIESLTATHAVVIDATAMVMWVGEGPSTLGRFHALDLRQMLGRAHGRAAPLDDLPTDRLLHSEEFADYREALAALDHAKFLLAHGHPERSLSSAKIALALAPDVGDLHRLLGDVERELGHLEIAKTHYRRYLELVPGRLREQERVRGILEELGE